MEFIVQYVIHEGQARIVRNYLTKECSEGRVLGPLDLSQYPFVHTSRIGVIPKGSSGNGS